MFPNRGRLPSLLKAAQDTEKFAQAAKFSDLKSPFSTSHGYSERKYAHTTNCSPQTQQIHGEA